MLTKLFRTRPNEASEKVATEDLSLATFKEIFARQAGGIGVITFYHEGDLRGFTATSITPASMEPPMALFCAGKKNQSHRYLKVDMRVGLSFLASDQVELSSRFARTLEPGAYADIELHEYRSGVPLLKGTLVSVEATICEIIPAGDHYVYLSRLQSAEIGEKSAPLVYYSRNHYLLGEILSTPAQTASAQSVSGGSEQ